MIISSPITVMTPDSPRLLGQGISDPSTVLGEIVDPVAWPVLRISYIEPPPPPPIPYPPTIAPIAPAGGETGVARDASISFTIRDPNVGDQVRRTSIRAFVEGVLIYNGLTNAFAQDWQASTITENAFNGYDFDLIPDLFARFDVGQIIHVRVLAQDLLGALTEESWTFTITTELAFRMRIYDMLLGSVRRQDS